MGPFQWTGRNLKEDLNREKGTGKLITVATEASRKERKNMIN
jgi:hypothetical protein